MSRKSDVRHPNADIRSRLGRNQNWRTADDAEFTNGRSPNEKGGHFTCNWNGSKRGVTNIGAFRSSAGFLWDFGLRIADFHRRAAGHLFLVLVVAAAAAGCRRDMFQQPYSKPLATSDFFQDNHMASRPLVAHTVARGHLDADEVLYTGKLGTNLAATFPFPVTRAVLERGQERFDIYCSPCHGRTGEGNGMIVQRGFPAPPSYHIYRLRQAPVGHFVDVITQGYGIMYSYAARVEPTDRWAIAAYIRVLQKSHDATLADVPTDQRTKLEAQK